VHFRPGSAHEQGDAVTAKRRHHIIIDHCSMSWANDEVASFYNNTDFTLQYSIISDSLNNAGHAKGNHGYGGIWGGQRASFIFNIVANHTSRNPRVNGYRLKPNYAAGKELVDIRNNVIYNWSENSAYGNEAGRFNMLNNVFKPGPANGPVRFFQINEPKDDEDLGMAHFSGNRMLGYPQLSANNMLGVEFKNEKKLLPILVEQLKSQVLRDEPFTDPEFILDEPLLSADQSYQQLVIEKEVGANRNRSGLFQDSVDTKLLSAVEMTSAVAGKGIIDNELQIITSWQAYSEEFNPLSAPISPIPDKAQIQHWIDRLGKF
jgi:hypothetical protein